MGAETIDMELSESRQSTYTRGRETRALMEALERRYAPSAYALIRNVADATGFQRLRTADAIVMSIWPSRGLELMGMELKVFRGDWLRELKDPAKADGIFRFCDRWWLVTNDPKIAHLNEIPAPWGWLCLNGNRWRVLKDAPKLKPEPISRDFLASLLRHINDDPIARVNEARQEGYESGRKTGGELQASTVATLQERIALFEQQSGLKIDQWYVGNIGDAVRRFMRIEQATDEHTRQFEYLLQQARNLVSSIERTAMEVQQWQAMMRTRPRSS